MLSVAAASAITANFFFIVIIPLFLLEKILLQVAPAIGFSFNTDPVSYTHLKTEIQKLVLKLADEGKSLIFISSEIEEMLRTCNRMAVLRDGQKVGEIDAVSYTHLQSDRSRCFPGGKRICMAKCPHAVHSGRFHQGKRLHADF